MNRSSVRFRSLAPVFVIDYQAVTPYGKPLDFFMLQFCFSVACAQEYLGTLSPFEAFLKHFLTKKWDGDHHKLHPDKSEPQEIRTLLSSTCQQQNRRARVERPEDSSVTHPRSSPASCGSFFSSFRVATALARSAYLQPSEFPCARRVIQAGITRDVRE